MLRKHLHHLLDDGWQPDARHPDFQLALMLNKVQMPVLFELSIVNEVNAWHAGMGESAAQTKVI